MNVMYLEYDVADYFSKVKPMDGTAVLDWGCNHANFLNYGAQPASYDGVDIDTDILLANQQKWPQYSWHHYPAYNWQYRCVPDADPDWPLSAQQTYDSILAFSVFTHTDMSEFRSTTNRMRDHLNTGGHVLASFISNQDFSIFCRIISHRPEYFTEADKGLFTTINRHPYSILVVEPDTAQKHLFIGMDRLPRFTKPVYFLSFFDDEWLADELGGTIERPDLEFDSGIRSAQRCLKLSTQA